MRLALVLLLLSGVAWANDYRVLDGHGGPVMDVAVSADGTRILTGSFDNSVGLWPAEGGAPVWLDGHEAAVKAVLFTGPGSAASGGDDFAVILWDLDTGDSQRLTGHRGQVKDLAVSPDGALLASASWDGTIGLWDIAEGRNLAMLSGHEAAVNDVIFADQGATLISASADGTIRAWDVGSRSETRILLRHGFGVTCLLLGPGEGWLVYGATDGGTRVIDMASDAVLADLTLERRPVLDIAANPDFSRIAVGDGEGHIMVVDTADWSIAHDFRAALTGPIWALAFEADGGAILAGGIDDAAVAWPVGTRPGGPILATTQRDFLRDPGTMGNGERQFRRKCSICHSLSDDGVRRAGPTLAGLFGRRAGSVPGYIYSDSVAGSGLVWSEETIDALFDIGPEHYLPGTKMPMQRIADPVDRSDLIDFLKDNT